MRLEGKEGMNTKVSLFPLNFTFLKWSVFSDWAATIVVSSGPSVYHTSFPFFHL